MNFSDTPQSNPEPTADPLPPLLAAAVARARAKLPAAADVERLIARASKLGLKPPVAVPARRLAWVKRAAVIATIAATILVVVTGTRHNRPVHAVPDASQRDVAGGVSNPIYSEVTKIPWGDADFAQVTHDLLQAESEANLAQESIALAEVRRDLRAALDEFPRWGN
ncbi:MAG: hypothetical protein V4719_12985 [Planctomycetota bacterium]